MKKQAVVNLQFQKRPQKKFYNPIVPEGKNMIFSLYLPIYSLSTNPGENLEGLKDKFRSLPALRDTHMVTSFIEETKGQTEIPASIIFDANNSILDLSQYNAIDSSGAISGE